MKNYIAFFEQEKGGAWNVLFPDLPGCFTCGDTFEEAVRMAHEALSLYADGEDMPEARAMEAIMSDWADWKKWKNRSFVVEHIALYPLKPKVRKFNIALDERIVQRIDRIAKNRSAFLASAAESFLDNAETTRKQA
jgi:predicted RNase H-like HicB family nuclease